MVEIKKQYRADFKFQLALEAAKGNKTLGQLASESGVHPNQIGQWKKQLLAGGPSLFAKPNSAGEKAREVFQAALYEQIGRLKMELEWLKKKLPDSVEQKRMMIDPTHRALSIRRQCELLGLNRSSFYYQPATETEMNLQLMRLIDEQYTRTPFYGYPRMTVCLWRQGYPVNRKRVARLMRVMGLSAIYPKPKTSLAAAGHRVYPYSLKGLAIARPNQVWSADITYIRMSQGFMYLVAIMDWYTRYVLAWALSNTLDGLFCLDALKQALGWGRPEIFNTDQGVQFTAQAFTGLLEEQAIRVSMDGRGRAFDNIFIERLWRTVKYEDIYLKDYATVWALDAGLEAYFDFYNSQRPHQSLGYKTPAELHFGEEWRERSRAIQHCNFVNLWS